MRSSHFGNNGLNNRFAANKSAVIFYTVRNHLDNVYKDLMHYPMPCMCVFEICCNSHAKNYM